MSECAHAWRRMTAEQDYGVWGPNWGEYKGFPEEICTKCKIKRRVRGWQEWRYELDDAEKRVEYLKSTEPSREHSSTGDGPKTEGTR